MDTVPLQLAVYLTMVLPRLRILPVLLWIASVLAALEDKGQLRDPLASRRNIVEWVRFYGGYFNDKQDFQREDPSDPSSRYGIFATERIEKGEKLASIPSKLMITSGKQSSSALNCWSALVLITELKKGPNSFYAPYTQYLLELPMGMQPSAWSDQGKDLLEEIVAYDVLPPVDFVSWLDVEWKEDCRGDNHPMTEHSAMLFLAHSDDDRMTPIADLYNHRNGRWYNTRTEFLVETHEIFASRVIQPGEQIYTSQNTCDHCENRLIDYGTPELLRDYGFVEELPQRWIFQKQGLSFEIDEDENGELQISWFNNTQAPYGSVGFVRAQLRRLRNVVEPDIRRAEEEQNLPPYELKIIRQYYNAITIAIAKVIEALGYNDDISCTSNLNEGDGSCELDDGYDDLKEIERKDKLYQHTCDEEFMREFENYEYTGKIKSVYQELSFYEHKEKGDMCFDLDGTVQVCSSYRPHYHEFMTHFPARYIDTIKRAVFVGGGDSMLLHELLKYPDIELIVGLELDQEVVRHSLIHFKTQPHFEDDRVQWWFGDATRSLLLLPKDYFGSFDLVLVDLSETVMSHSVTKDLDMLQTLALLLKPDGIFVKNEQYFNKLSTMFDYTIQAYFTNVPWLCDQAYAMGSNRIDFLHPNVDNLVQGHSIDAMVLEPIQDAGDRFMHIHHYQKSDARAQGKCGELDKNVKLKRAGLLLILEAENARGDLKGEKLEHAIEAALTKEGLKLVSQISDATGGKTRIVIVMREGIVVARTWPKQKYCAFDVQMWGHFEKMEPVKVALVDAVGSGSGSTSSYRVVVGGLRGIDIWEESRQYIGPSITQQRDCREISDESVHAVEVSITPKAVDTLLEESLSLIQDPGEGIVAAAVCGDRDMPCRSVDVLSKSDKVSILMEVWPCRSIESAPYLEDTLSSMFACEMEILRMLRNNTGQSGKLAAVVVDPSAPIALVKILEKIFRNPRNQRRLLRPYMLFFVPMPDSTETWRRNFLERCRNQIVFDYLNRAQVILKGSGSSVEIGILTSNDPYFIRHLEELTTVFNNRTGLDVQAQKIKGHPLREQVDYESKPFKTSDYDARPAEIQLSRQKPLGEQTVVQLKVGKDERGTRDAFIEEFKRAFEATLREEQFSKSEAAEYSDLGSGSVLVAVALEGTAIAVWDGKMRITLNLFVYDSADMTKFVDSFSKRLPGAKRLLCDIFPRGTDRVVNRKNDLSRSTNW